MLVNTIFRALQMKNCKSKMDKDEIDYSYSPDNKFE
jgi:hypothetical protein